MTESWGGAQWVLATLIFMRVTIPLTVRAGGVRFVGDGEKPRLVWLAEYLAKLTTIVGLVIILAWGGFWR